MIKKMKRFPLVLLLIMAYKLEKFSFTAIDFLEKQYLKMGGKW